MLSFVNSISGLDLDEVRISFRGSVKLDKGNQANQPRVWFKFILIRVRSDSGQLWLFGSSFQSRFESRVMFRYSSVFAAWSTRLLVPSRCESTWCVLARFRFAFKFGSGNHFTFVLLDFLQSYSCVIFKESSYATKVN
ncbi:hypothetical protein HanXRQr2_Chr08g0332071 [Helianthus annuus]|uniref:Uncharacterized protein n=1 Tax=Helianthus annuus TaxID=4232 RepID=A0A251U499_HELAN|nr:hypothetical protein HanXRQr2_Chr08g0332071 [Helianthus annuus]